jgi:hypothetical protein
MYLIIEIRKLFDERNHIFYVIYAYSIKDIYAKDRQQQVKRLTELSPHLKSAHLSPHLYICTLSILLFYLHYSR